MEITPQLPTLTLIFAVFLAALLLQYSEASNQLAEPLRRSTRLHGIAAQTPLQKVLQRYFSNEELEAHLQDFVTRCGAIAQRTKIGDSVQGRPLWVLEISDRPGQQEAEPSFKYIANMHGDETGGRQLLLGLAEWLCANYETNPAAGRVVKGVHLFLMPTMNPDGYAAGQRENANWVDLNRNFPDPIESPSMQPTGLEEPETRAVMNWTLSRTFVASANMHEGALVVNYPYDGGTGHSGYYNATPDDSTFLYLSKVYSQYNKPMWQSQLFKSGVTNGADWYFITGGMQDWNYVAAGCFEVTLELWDRKGGADLRTLFDNNLQSLLQFALTATLGGIRGKVLEKVAGRLMPLQAVITVKGSPTITRTNPLFGDFYRPLAPGKYVVEVSAPGYLPKVARVTVPADGGGVSRKFVFP